MRMFELHWSWKNRKNGQKSAEGFGKVEGIGGSNLGPLRSPDFVHIFLAFTLQLVLA